MTSPVHNWRKTKKLHQNLGKNGKLLVWTQVSTPPTGFEYQAPYFVGLVELEDKTRLPVQIVDCDTEELKPNLKIKLVLRRLKKPGPNDLIDYIIKATPV